ncbi:MAG TPA: ATP-binding protein, partial [Thermoanaerobaculia bacterium]|nr:ATP-binding protein [Thermoanaerobaculia bacterium]
NAARHAGARGVEVTILAVDGRITAEVRDDGTGFARAEGAADTAGNGLRNMQARAREVGGRLTIESGPGRGTVVRVEAPL